MLMRDGLRLLQQGLALGCVVVFDHLVDGLEQGRQCRQLARMDGRALRDIGLTRAMADEALRSRGRRQG